MMTLHFVAILVLGFAINDLLLYIVYRKAFNDAFNQYLLTILGNKKSEPDNSDPPLTGTTRFNDTLH